MLLDAAPHRGGGRIQSHVEAAGNTRCQNEKIPFGEPFLPGRTRVSMSLSLSHALSFFLSSSPSCSLCRLADVGIVRLCLLLFFALSPLSCCVLYLRYVLLYRVLRGSHTYRPASRHHHLLLPSLAVFLPLCVFVCLFLTHSPSCPLPKKKNEPSRFLFFFFLYASRHT